jgi:catechol 2,3-dioxygenase-like lactoylglutathione lyase family enzyme
MSSKTKQLTRRDLMRNAAVCGAGVAAAGLPSFAATAGDTKSLKATWVNHYVYVAPDMNKTVDWYHEVFGMQIGAKNKKETHMWYGDAGGNTCMIIRQSAPGTTEAKIINFAFTIDDWDHKAVEAELKRRNLNPVADTSKCFRFKDLEGFDIAVCAKDYLKAPAPSTETPALWKTLSANHIVELSPDYGKLKDWYKDLLDLRVSHDSGRDTYMWLGDTVWIPTQVRAGGKNSASLGTLDHVAYTISDFKKDAVEAELKKRDMNPRLDTELSFNCVDINKFKTQVCDKQLVPEAEKRPARGGRGPGVAPTGNPPAVSKE